MLNEFIQKKNQMGTVLRNVEEMTKLKRYVKYSGDIQQLCVQNYHLSRYIIQYMVAGKQKIMSYFTYDHRPRPSQ